MINISFTKVRDAFHEYNALLKSSQPWAIPALRVAPNNSKLLTAASRITTPTSFQAFIDIIKNRIGFEISPDMLITKDYVLEQDSIALDRYSTENFDYSKLNLDNLIKSSIQSSMDLNFDQGFYTTRVDDCWKGFPKGTSSCYPLYLSKSDPEAVEEGRAFLAKYLEDETPSFKHLFGGLTTLFHRYQFKVDKDGAFNKKVRIIWGIPFGISQIESYFFRDAINRIPASLISTGKITTTLGLNLQDISRKIISPFKSKSFNSDFILSLDLKGFDSTVPSFMWPLFYANFRQCLDLDNKFNLHFACLMVYHNYTPYVYMGKSVRFTRKGTPSGSLITALFNTWVNRTIINYAHLEKGLDFPQNKLSVLGDDNLLQLNNQLSLNYLTDVFKRFGIIVNKLKTKVTRVGDDFDFLGYTWDFKNEAVQSELWFITHICLSSTFYTNLDIPISVFQTYRAISVCMPLANGFEMFNRLLGEDDKVYRELVERYNRGEQTIIPFITSDKRYNHIKFPFELFLRGTWSQRQSSVSKSQL